MFPGCVTKWKISKKRCHYSVNKKYSRFLVTKKKKIHQQPPLSSGRPYSMTDCSLFGCIVTYRRRLMYNVYAWIFGRTTGSVVWYQSAILFHVCLAERCHWRINISRTSHRGSRNGFSPRVDFIYYI